MSPLSSGDDTRPAGPPPGDVAPVESEPEGAEVEQPPAAADDPHPEETRSDTAETGVDSPAPQQEQEPPTHEPAPEDTAAPAETPATPPSAPAEEGASEPPTAESPEPTPPPFDERRSPIVDRIKAKLGDAVVASEVLPERDIWVRVTRDAWADAARVLREDLGFTYFCFLSAIDWMPSPYGKSEDDTAPVEVNPNGPFDQGVTGGDTRFQLLARVESPGTGIGITLKADVGDDMTAPTWSNTYAGADWHERETWEMFGITFTGHPNLIHIYLPGEFEGYPLRKDFPLLSRMVKPWPGLVDVEPMPGEDPDEAEEGAETEAAE